jgi:hypothetical protein
MTPVQGYRITPGLGSMRRHVLHHVCFLSKSSTTDMTNKGLFSSMDLQMLFKVEPFGINKKTTNRATFIIRQ